MIGAALRDEEISTSAANIASAVTSAQQVRGIVAGPQQVAIGEVGRSIQTAFAESENLLRSIAASNTQIARNTARGGAGSLDPDAGDEASQALTNESPSFV